MAVAQTTASDSLETLLTAKQLTRTEQINIYDALSRNYITTNIGKAKLYGYRGLALAIGENNQEMQAHFYRNIGSVFTIMGVYDSAAFYLEKATATAKLVNDANLQAYILLGVATLNARTNNYQDALQQFFKVLQVFEKNGNRLNERKTLGSIAALYMYQENYNQAEKYYNQAEKIALEIADSSGLGQAYQGLSRISLMRKQTSKALDYAKRSASCFHASGETVFESVAMKEIANIYLAGNDIKRATEFAQASLKIAKTVNVPRYISNALVVLSDIAFHQKNYNESMAYAMEAIKNDSSDADTRTRMLENLVKASAFSNQPGAAVSYFGKYRSLIDMRINETYQKSLSEMEVKYETEKKEFRITSLEKEKKLYGFLTLTGALALLFLILMLYLREKNEKHKKELAEQRVAQLEQEKKLIATKAVLDGETAERTRLARDLHDGLGSMLSVIKLNLNDVKKRINLEGDNAEHFNHALEMLESSAIELRRMAHNMMPESLSKYGLKASLQDFLSSIPNARLHHFGEDERIDPKLEIIIYRTAHELVNNAMRHSEAQNINVQIVQHPDSISLTVQDDGKGFNPATVIEEGHGLKNIESRVDTFNGSMNIFSQPEQGTEITVEFKITRQV
ncbi:MAG: sensor histidine kinase [Lacibacter sp.]